MPSEILHLSATDSAGYLAYTLRTLTVQLSEQSAEEQK